MPWQFEIPIEVRPEHFDEMDHINNAVFLQYAEQIARAHAEKLGLGWDELVKLGHAFVVRRHEVEYICAGNKGDVLRARTKIMDVKGPRATRHVQILRGDDVLVDVKTTWIWVNLETRYPARIPKEIAEGWPKSAD